VGVERLEQQALGSISQGADMLGKCLSVEALLVPKPVGSGRDMFT
jgi:hypothetical protein